MTLSSGILIPLFKQARQVVQYFKFIMENKIVQIYNKVSTGGQWRIWLLILYVNFPELTSKITVTYIITPFYVIGTSTQVPSDQISFRNLISHTRNNRRSDPNNIYWCLQCEPGYDFGNRVPSLFDSDSANNSTPSARTECVLGAVVPGDGGEGAGGELDEGGKGDEGRAGGWIRW